jgi:redox-sensitive bicupin YhaK (pirin superfamily)
MLEKIPFESLGAADFGWLKAKHHFSFGRYIDRNRMGVGALRVWNDDEIDAGAGFDPHPHKDMEIVTYVREGAITHRDSLGNEGRTGAGDVQVMSAGDGITHSEYNLEAELTRLFQIWFVPRTGGGAPWWEARKFPPREAGQGFLPLASGYDEHINAGAIAINSDAALLAAALDAGDAASYALQRGEKAYLVVAKGAVAVNGETLGERDALQISNEASLVVVADADAEILLAVLS